MRRMRNENLEIKNKILNNDYDRFGALERLPLPNEARDFVKNRLKISNNVQKLILVEDLGNYKVYIQFPGKKSEFDFIVWRFSPILDPDLKIPTHVDLGEIFL